MIFCAVPWPSHRFHSFSRVVLFWVPTIGEAVRGLGSRHFGAIFSARDFVRVLLSFGVLFLSQARVGLPL